jgi:hypothetical protein
LSQYFSSFSRLVGAMHVFRYLCVLDSRGDQTGVARVLADWQSEILNLFYSANFFIMHKVELQVMEYERMRGF